MPSIALFIKELLSEDKYSSDFNERIGERIASLNAAQLQGLYNHLLATAKSAKSEIWTVANQDLVNKIEGTLKVKMDEAKAVEKLLEEEAIKEVQKRRNAIAAKKETRRVMHMIASNARETAEKEVKEAELKRQAAEKIEIMDKVYKAEERRNKWWIRIVVAFILLVVAIVLAVPDLLIMMAAIVFVLLVSIALAYYASTFTTIVPTIIPEDELEQQINQKEDLYKKKAVSVLREKERKFQEQQRRDKIERRQRKELKRQQNIFEANLIEQRRLEHIAMAKEVLSTRQIKKHNGLRSLSSSSFGRGSTAGTVRSGGSGAEEDEHKSQLSSLENNPANSVVSFVAGVTLDGSVSDLESLQSAGEEKGAVENRLTAESKKQLYHDNDSNDDEQEEHDDDEGDEGGNYAGTVSIFDKDYHSQDEMETDGREPPAVLSSSSAAHEQLSRREATLDMRNMTALDRQHSVQEEALVMVDLDAGREAVSGDAHLISPSPSPSTVPPPAPAITTAPAAVSGTEVEVSSSRAPDKEVMSRSSSNNNISSSSNGQGKLVLTAPTRCTVDKGDLESGLPVGRAALSPRAGPSASPTVCHAQSGIIPSSCSIVPGSTTAGTAAGTSGISCAVDLEVGLSGQQSPSAGSGACGVTCGVEGTAIDVIDLEDEETLPPQQHRQHQQQQCLKHSKVGIPSDQLGGSYGDGEGGVSEVVSGDSSVGDDQHSGKGTSPPVLDVSVVDVDKMIDILGDNWVQDVLLAPSTGVDSDAASGRTPAPAANSAAAPAAPAFFPNIEIPEPPQQQSLVRLERTPTPEPGPKPKPEVEEQPRKGASAGAIGGGTVSGSISGGTGTYGIGGVSVGVGVVGTGVVGGGTGGGGSQKGGSFRVGFDFFLRAGSSRMGFESSVNGDGDGNGNGSSVLEPGQTDMLRRNLSSRERLHMMRSESNKHTIAAALAIIEPSLSDDELTLDSESTTKQQHYNQNKQCGSSGKGENTGATGGFRAASANHGLEGIAGATTTDSAAVVVAAADVGCAHADDDDDDITLNSLSTHQQAAAAGTEREREIGTMRGLGDLGVDTVTLEAMGIDSLEMQRQMDDMAWSPRGSSTASAAPSIGSPAASTGADQGAVAAAVEHPIATATTGTAAVTAADMVVDGSLNASKE